MDERTMGLRTPVARSLERFRWQVRRRAALTFSDSFFRGLSAAAKLHPLARPGRHHVQVLRDIPYTNSGSPDHLLDIYRPTVRRGPFPVVLYIHGGGFRLLSKDTHWVMGLAFARLGYLVFNISYRLAPRHPFPAAIEDACAAYEWMVANAGAYGGDLDRVVVAGESAGGNLAASLALATSYRRPEPYARRVFDLGVAPQVAMPFCAILQVSNTARFGARRKLPGIVETILKDVGSSYLRGVTATGRDLDLADPLVALERGEPPDRPLPAFFAPVGTRDPLLDDTRRLVRALDALGVANEARYYPGEVHAFQALVMRRPARRCWRHAFAFLDRHLPPARPDEESPVAADAAAESA